MGPTEAKSGQAAKRPMAATPGASLPRNVPVRHCQSKFYTACSRITAAGAPLFLLAPALGRILRRKSSLLIYLDSAIRTVSRRGMALPRVTSPKPRLRASEREFPAVSRAVGEED